MRGLLLYCQKDYEKNKDFARWIIEEFSKHKGQVEIVLKEELNGGELKLDFDFVINRTRDYNLSLLFELNQIRVYNSSEITLLGNNKLAGYAYAQKKGFAFARVALPNFRERRELLAKPIYGHGGQGIYLFKEVAEWRQENVNQVFLTDIIGDIRFYILNNRIHAAVLRRSANGLTANFSTGGSVESYCYDASEEALVQKFIGELTIDYAGVDFLLGKNGELMFNEIEDVAGSRMLSHMGINDIVPLWVENIAQEQEKLRGRR